ncbi:P-loop containing nucleoside triphosphate hydrolase protein [Lipomyces starkeyi]
MQGLKRGLEKALPSQFGQSVEHSIPAVREGTDIVEKTTVVREVTEVYPEAVDAKLSPVTPATFRLLFELRGVNATFRSALQAAAIQTIIINPGYSFLVVLPTGAALYEFRNNRITVLVVPFVALRYDIVDRVEDLDGGHFRQIFSELLFKKSGYSLIARVFFDEAHTIHGHWDFRPSFQAITNITSFTIPVVLLSATVPPTRLNDIRKVYSRLDLRVIRAPSTARPNIVYEVCQTTDRSFVFCMSKATVKLLYEEFSDLYENIGFFHGELTVDGKADVLSKWITGTYRILFTTSGFGVGVDCDSVTLVIHYEGIWSLLDFVQESGRAGRNNKPAKSVVLLRNNWHPNYQRLLAGEAQGIDDYVSPDGFCRRYTIGHHMDGAGFTCMTHTYDVELCDICNATRAELVQSEYAQDQTPKVKSRQHPESALTAVKRLKGDTSGPMREIIYNFFSHTMTEYSGCVLCATTPGPGNDYPPVECIHTREYHVAFQSHYLSPKEILVHVFLYRVRSQNIRCVTGTK